MNILESLFRTTDQSTPLPHLGEVYGVWFYDVLCSAALSFCQLSINHAHNPELGAMIRDLAHNLEEPQLKKLGEFLTREGVPFPMNFPRHPKADPDSIPPGARMEDIEIANLHAMKLQALLATCSANMQQALREDIGAMYMGVYTQLIAHSLQTKKLMQKHGWLIEPPSYAPASISH